MTSKQFFFFVSLVTFAGALLRLSNLTYASLWADELYSMLSVHPGNSWYEILYMQRTYQPPAYFMLLWGWTSVFGYTDFSARVLSVLGGILAIVLSALLGKKIKDNRLGLLLAILVAFNPMQIFFSLEARFYIFTYCIAVMSLWLQWHLLWKRNASLFLYLVLSGINAALCYFHHFGIFFVFGLFLHDLLVFRKEKDRAYFFRKLGVYSLAAILYSPWFFWGLLQGLSTTNFWLKEINLWQYFIFSLDYSVVMNIGLCGLVMYYLFLLFKGEIKYGGLFPVLVLSVILLPLIYSFVRFPILVDRYSTVMAPAIYLMIGIALLRIYDRLRQANLRVAGSVIFLAAFSIPGIYMSLLNKEKLLKQPWREMSAWLKQQPDLKETNVYASGIWLKNRFTIDYYLAPGKKAKQFYDMKVGEDTKMYLVESSYVWSIKPDLLEKIKAAYEIQIVPFLADRADFGRIYICKKKQLVDTAQQNTAHAF
jgi:uncharacterized membrane protein